jgi:hypothetical protein
LPFSSFPKAIRVGLLVGVLGLAFARPASSQEVTLLYPDLRPVSPLFVLVDFVRIEGVIHYVLRFDATIWNSGQGPLELRGDSSDEHRAYQRIYDDSGGFTDEELAGGFTLFEPHQHWHFEDFAEYQLWTKAEFDAWLASGRQDGEPRWRGSKTTGQVESFCIRDSDPVQPLERAPQEPQYVACDQELQGISAGWADTYPFTLPQQWIELGTDDLPSGIYVLRIVADPRQILDQGDRDYVEPYANEALTVFRRAPLETEVLANPYARSSD